MDHNIRIFQEFGHHVKLLRRVRGRLRDPPLRDDGIARPDFILLAVHFRCSLHEDMTDCPCDGGISISDISSFFLAVILPQIRCKSSSNIRLFGDIESLHRDFLSIYFLPDIW